VAETVERTGFDSAFRMRRVTICKIVGGGCVKPCRPDPSRTMVWSWRRFSRVSSASAVSIYLLRIARRILSAMQEVMGRLPPTRHAHPEVRILLIPQQATGRMPAVLCTAGCLPHLGAAFVSGHCRSKANTDNIPIEEIVITPA